VLRKAEPLASQPASHGGTQEAETGQIGSQPGVHSKTVSKQRNKQKINTRKRHIDQKELK
jgi:hypothetical protein